MRHAKETEETASAAKGGLVSRLLTIFGIILLVLALGIGGYIAWSYIDAQNRYSHIQSVAGLDVSQPEAVDPNLKLEDLIFDWDALRQLNADVVGWIIIPGTNVNYPIVQGSDNSYYLYRLFDTTSSGTGAIFADYEGAPTLDGQHNIIYGHNMFDGSMFSDVLMYTNQDYFNAHRVVYLCTPEKNYELSALATINVPEDAELRKFTFDTEEAFDTFLAETLAAPETVSPDLASELQETQSLYSLVTCETFDASRRIILCCIPVRSVEPNNA